MNLKDLMPYLNDNPNLIITTESICNRFGMIPHNATVLLRMAKNYGVIELVNDVTDNGRISGITRFYKILPKDRRMARRVI